MTLALSFVEPLLLLGLAAAALPLVLHLLSSVRAQETPFPTLRFLRVSMEKTARRRRIQHWLLMLLRALVLGLLALAVAQPISEAAGGWIDARRSAAVVVLDNSYSMAAGAGQSRFDRARAMARDILSTEPEPALAGLMTTSGGHVSRGLSADLDTLRRLLEQTPISYEPDALSSRVSEAIDLLIREPSAARKAVYVLTDLQRSSLDKLIQLRQSAEAGNVHVLIVDTSRGQVDNVGITALDVRGHRVAGAQAELSVTVTNSSPTARTARLEVRLQDQRQGPGRVVNLAPAGSDGSVAAITFPITVPAAGTLVGRAVLDVRDQLPQDNTRSFAIEAVEPARVLVVRGPETEDALLDPAELLLSALWPGELAWPVRTRAVAHDQFTPADLADVSAAFFCEAPTFTPDQAEAIARFTRSGGTTVFFPGPDILVDRYNAVLGERAGLLPARLGPARGVLGLDAPAIPAGSADLNHPLLAGLYPRQSLYLDRLMAQRYFQLPIESAEADDPAPRVLVRLANGQPLLVSRPLGRGLVVLSAVPASLRWSSLPRARLFLPLMTRLALASVDTGDRRASWPTGGQIALTPELDDVDPQQATVSVTLPADESDEARTVSLGIQQRSQGPAAVLTETDRPGIYRWELSAGDGEVRSAGALAVNPIGSEGDLSALPAGAVAEALRRRGLSRAYAGQSVEAVHAAAAADTAGRNWWDLLAGAVIFLLVIEAVAANRFRAQPG
jgi:hypothetical protein